MNENDLHTLLKELSRPGAPQVPGHQKMLRARLLETHAAQQTVIRRFLGTFTIINPSTGVPRMNKKLITIGASALAISLFAVGIMALGGPQNSVSASQLVEGASKRMQQMSPEEIAAINERHQQDLNQRLEEAKKNKTLKVLNDDDLTDWGWGPKRYEDSIKSYVGYIDSNSHRIIIGLGDNERPLFVVDITIDLEAKRQAEERLKNNPSANEEAASPSNGIKTPKMEVN